MATMDLSNEWTIVFNQFKEAARCFVDDDLTKYKKTIADYKVHAEAYKAIVGERMLWDWRLLAHINEEGWKDIEKLYEVQTNLVNFGRNLAWNQYSERSVGMFRVEVLEYLDLQPQLAGPFWPRSPVERDTQILPEEHTYQATNEDFQTVFKIINNQPSDEWKQLLKAIEEPAHETDFKELSGLSTKYNRSSEQDENKKIAELYGIPMMAIHGIMRARDCPKGRVAYWQERNEWLRSKAKSKDPLSYKNIRGIL
ncbi:hypothetical protein CC80DRAFT_560998 [Byssothecium circinans]|uniref:Uncharacterized protein n=1 Tax=Byssothecium circinans TaxID=147558 RepID=A0A6A5TXJ5_9PLEO|nr:hypothetical protein CC80DRAFT_560998 [Byssothecium circinans]